MSTRPAGEPPLGYNVTLVDDAHTTTDTKVLTVELVIAHANRLFNGFDNLEHYVEVKLSHEVSFR